MNKFPIRRRSIDSVISFEDDDIVYDNGRRCICSGAYLSTKNGTAPFTVIPPPKGNMVKRASFTMMTKYSVQQQLFSPNGVPPSRSSSSSHVDNSFSDSFGFNENAWDDTNNSESMEVNLEDSNEMNSSVVPSQVDWWKQPQKQNGKEGKMQNRCGQPWNGIKRTQIAQNPGTRKEKVPTKDANYRISSLISFPFRQNSPNKDMERIPYKIRKDESSQSLDEDDDINSLG